MPPGLRLAPRDVVLAVETFLKRLTPIALSAEEYLETLRSTANLARFGERFTTRCTWPARKVDAKRIYTWNVRHFRMVAPDLAGRIVTP